MSKRSKPDSKRPRKTGKTKSMDYVMYSAPAQRGMVPARSRGPEKKSVDSGVLDFRFDDTGSLAHIGGVVPGPGRWERIGRKINYRSVHIKGCIVLSATGAGVKPTEYCRLVLIYDRQPNGAVPVISDILADVSSAGATVTSAFSGLNLNNSDRFLVLRDGRYALPGQNSVQSCSVTSTNSEDPADINWYVKLKDLPCEYKGDTAGIASISSGALYLFSFSDEPAATMSWIFRGACRTRYVDY